MQRQCTLSSGVLQTRPKKYQLDCRGVEPAGWTPNLELGRLGQEGLEGGRDGLRAVGVHADGADGHARLLQRRQHPVLLAWRQQQDRASGCESLEGFKGVPLFILYSGLQRIEGFALKVSTQPR